MHELTRERKEGINYALNVMVAGLNGLNDLLPCKTCYAKGEVGIKEEGTECQQKV